MILTDELLDALMQLSEMGDPPPWVAVIEGRDQESGNSFIQVGGEEDRAADIYVSRDSGPAAAAELDLIAAARTYLPALIAEVRMLRSTIGDVGGY